MHRRTTLSRHWSAVSCLTAYQQHK